MNDRRFANFGELYRAAFAERDPIKKQIYLREVKDAIDRCSESPRHLVNEKLIREDRSVPSAVWRQRAA
jgi:hypothetical protein